MKYVGMFINLSSGDIDQGEIACRKKAFWDDGVKSVYTDEVTLLPFVYGQGVYHTYQQLACQLVQSSPSLKDTVFFAPCGPSLWALQIATANTAARIVCGGVVDPYNTGVVMDGYNVAGYSSYAIDKAADLLQALKDKYDPKDAGVVWDPQMRAAVGQMAVIVAKANELTPKINLIQISIRADDVNRAIKDFAAKASDPKCLIVLTSTYTATQRDLIIAAVKQYNIKAIYPNALYVRSGGGLSYGPPTIDLYKCAGICAGRMLKNEDVDFQINNAYEWCPPQT
jgi:putative ABC transport system substrate-binding protein